MVGPTFTFSIWTDFIAPAQPITAPAQFIVALAQLITAPAQFITAPAQPPATGAVVYTALFSAEFHDVLLLCKVNLATLTLPCNPNPTL